MAQFCNLHKYMRQNLRFFQNITPNPCMPEGMNNRHGPPNLLPTRKCGVLRGLYRLGFWPGPTDYRFFRTLEVTLPLFYDFGGDIAHFVSGRGE